MPESTRSSPSADISSDHVWITVLAGGIGSRFWPVSTPARPKQLLPLASERPLILDTVQRARALVPPDRIRILAGEALVEPFRSVLGEVPASTFMVEPAARGTAPVLTWAAHAIHREDPDAVLVSLHSDHLIRPLEAFRSAVLGAARVAGDQDLLLCLGVPPERPDTGYGYVQPGAPLDAPAGRPRSPGRESTVAGGPPGLDAWEVEAFHEKPDAATAARYLDQGYLWNSGIFVWRASVFLEEVRRRAPGVGDHLPLLDAGDVEGFFAAVEPSTVDVAVMERSDRVGVVRAPFEWDDVGSWEAVYRTRDADEDGNVRVGSGLVREGRGNVVFAEEGHVVLFGVDDLVVVRSGGVTMVTTRRRSADLKSLLDALPPDVRGAP